MPDFLSNLNVLFFTNKIIFIFIILIGFIIGNFVKTRYIYEAIKMENDFKYGIVEALNMLNPEIEKECLILDKLNLDLNTYNKFFGKNTLETFCYGIFFSLIGVCFYFFYDSIIDFIIYYSIFICFSILVLVDHITKYLPVEKLNLLMFFGIFLSLSNEIYHYSNFIISLKNCVTSFMLGYVILFSLNWFSVKISKKNVIGSGDFILFASLGAFFGLNSIFYSIFISAIYCCIYALIINHAFKRGVEVAFGPSLFLSVITAYFLDYYDFFDFLYILNF